MLELFTVCTEQLRSPYTEHAASGLPNPAHLEEEIRFDQPQDQQIEFNTYIGERVTLNPGLDSIRDVASAIISHEESQ